MKQQRLLVERARRMRHEGSDAEARLWSRLRNRRLSGWKFRRQHPLGSYILDFYCTDGELAVELDGGGHGEAATATYDTERTRALEALGIRVLRFWNDVALRDTDTVLEQILNALNPPSPRPSPQRGEGATSLTPSPRPSPQRGEGGLSPQAGRGGGSHA